MKGKPPEEVYRLKKEVLGEMEIFSAQGLIKLYYGDEAGVSREPCVPRGWQFKDEEVSMPTAKGKGVNCFGLFTRNNEAITATSETTITAAFVVEQLERLSFSIKQMTVVVLEQHFLPIVELHALIKAGKRAGPQRPADGEGLGNPAG